MTRNCIYARSKWLLFLCLAAGLVFCSVRPVWANCGDNNPSDCPEAFGDGIYKKFNLDLGNAGRTHRWAIFTYGSGTSSSPFTALDVSSPTSTTPGFQIMGDIALAGAYSNLRVSGYGSVS